MTTPAMTKVKALCVATRCTNVEQFVATFHRFCEDDAFFVATLTTRPVGLQTPFAIQLADKTPVLRGLCVVREAWDHPENPFGRPGIRLGIVRLTSDSTEVFEKLRARRRATTSSTFDEPAAAITQTPTAVPAASKPITTQPFPGPAANRVTPSPPAKTPNAVPMFVRANEHQTSAQPFVATRMPRRPDSVPAASTSEDDVTTPTPSAASSSPAREPAAAAVPSTAPLPAIPSKPPAKLEPAAITKLISPLHGGTLSTRPGSNPSIHEIPMPKLARANTPPPMRVPDIAPPAPAPDSSTRDIDLPPPVRIEPKRTREPVPDPVPPAASEPTPHLDEQTPFHVPFDDLAIPVEPPKPAPPAPEPRPPSPDVVPANPFAGEATEVALAIGRVPTGAIDPHVANALRTPGSELVLPANPLMNLSDESLEGFVDCTLYEETGAFPLDDEASGDVDPPIAPPEPEPSRLPSLGGPLELPTPSLVLGGPDSTPAGGIAMPRTRTVDRRTPTPVPVRQADDDAYAPDIALSREPIGHAIEPAPAPPLPAMPTIVPLPPPRRSRWWLAVVLLALVAGAVALVVTRPWVDDRQANASPTPSAQPTRVAELAVDAGAPEVAEPQEPVEPAEPPPPPGTYPVVGKGPCRVNVVATPAGANVAVDGQFLGPAPLSVDGPCAARKVDLSHPRYAFTSRTVTPTEGEPATVDVTMVRPTHAVTVVTRPTGATVLIDGRRAGTSPTVINVMGFQSISLGVQKPGYRPVTQRLYSRNAKDRVVIELQSELFPPKRK